MKELRHCALATAAIVFAIACTRENDRPLTPASGVTGQLPPASGFDVTPHSNEPPGAASTGNPGAGSITTGSGPGTTGTASGHPGPTTIAPGTVAPGSANVDPETKDSDVRGPSGNESTRGTGIR